MALPQNLVFGIDSRLWNGVNMITIFRHSKVFKNISHPLYSRFLGFVRLTYSNGEMLARFRELERDSNPEEVAEFNADAQRLYSRAQPNAAGAVGSSSQNATATLQAPSAQPNQIQDASQTPGSQANEATAAGVNANDDARDRHTLLDRIAPLPRPVEPALEQVVRPLQDEPDFHPCPYFDCEGSDILGFTTFVNEDMSYMCSACYGQCCARCHSIWAPDHYCGGNHR